jgi:hypothetical protein
MMVKFTSQARIKTYSSIVDGLKKERRWTNNKYITVEEKGREKNKKEKIYRKQE